VDIHCFRRHVCRERDITRHTFHLPACRLALQVRSVHTSARRRQYLCTIMVSARYRVGMPAEDIEAPGIADALAVLRKALDAAEAAPPGPRKTSLLRDLAQWLPELATRAQDLRRAEMRRAYEIEDDSLAALGRQYHMSKANAARIIGKRGREGREQQ